MKSSHQFNFGSTLKYFRLSVIASGMLLMHSVLYAGLNGPSMSIHPGLSASSAAGKDELISEHKVVIDSFSRPDHQWQPTADIQAKICDGDFNTSSKGEILWLSLDLGDTYVVDSSVVSFDKEVHYAIAYSLDIGGGLPPTYDLAKGYGLFPSDGASHLDFHPLLWVEPAALIDKRKLTPTPARFLRFHFHAESDFNYGVVNEVQVFGHKYVPAYTDLIAVNRQKWTSSASSCNQCDEGFTGYQMYDYLLSSPKIGNSNPGDWEMIDFHESVTFTQISLMIAAEGQTLNVFVTNDTTNWGSSISTLVSPKDSVVLNVPKQQARYLKIVNQGKSNDYWRTYDVNLLAPLSDNPVSLKRADKIRKAFSIHDLNGAFYNTAGRKISTLRNKTNNSGVVQTKLITPNAL